MYYVAVHTTKKSAKSVCLQMSLQNRTEWIMFRWLLKTQEACSYGMKESTSSDICTDLMLSMQSPLKIHAFTVCVWIPNTQLPHVIFLKFSMVQLQLLRAPDMINPCIQCHGICHCLAKIILQNLASFCFVFWVPMIPKINSVITSVTVEAFSSENKRDINLKVCA